MGVAAEAPHPNAARVLTNWFMSQKGQQVMTETIGVHPVVNGVTLPPTMESYEGLKFETFVHSSRSTDARSRNHRGMGNGVGVQLICNEPIFEGGCFDTGRRAAGAYDFGC